MDEDELVSIAQQLAGRVREDGVEDYTRWLTLMVPDPKDWFRLAVVLACAVPVDVRWSVLVGWVDCEPDGAGRQTEKLRPHGTIAAVRRHQKARERPCELCRAAEAQRGRMRRARQREAA